MVVLVGQKKMPLQVESTLVLVPGCVVVDSNDIFVIRVSIEASEVSIIVCTIVPSNCATDVMAGWRFCAGIGENGVLKGERSTFSLSIPSILSCRVLTSVSF